MLFLVRFSQFIRFIWSFQESTTKKIVGEVFLLNRKWFLFTMCYLVCSDIAHFDGKSKKNPISQRKTKKKLYAERCYNKSMVCPLLIRCKTVANPFLLR